MPELFEDYAISSILNNYNTKLHIATWDEISAVLREDIPIPWVAEGYSPKNNDYPENIIFPVGIKPHTISTRTDSPAVLMGGFMAGCSAVFTFDKPGNGINRHYAPWIYHSLKSVEDDQIMKDYAAYCKENFSQDRLWIITGTNGGSEYRDKVIAAVRKSLPDDEDVEYLLVKKTDSLVYTELPPEIKHIYGLIFVPMQLSTTGLNHLFIMNDSDAVLKIVEAVGLEAKIYD